MSDLARFQARFARALLDPEDDGAGLGLGPALAVYRNNVAAAGVEALAAAFPTVRQMVGEDWFDAAALAFLRERPPEDPRLSAYGGDFPDWLAAFPPARDLPYLAPVARLDRAWLEAHLAAGPQSPPAALRPPADLSAHRGTLHPTLRLFRFSTSVPSLWLAHRFPADTPGDLAFVAADEPLAIWRPQHEVRARKLDPQAYAFLAACRDGRSLAAARAAALAAGPPGPALALAETLSAEGLLTGFTPLDPRP